LQREAIQTWALSTGAAIPELDDAVYTRWSFDSWIVNLTLAGRITGGQAHAKQVLQQATRDLLFAWSHRTT